MNNPHYLIILLASLLLSACIQHTPYRNIIPNDKPVKCKVDAIDINTEMYSATKQKVKSYKALPLCDDEKYVSHAIQNRHYKYWPSNKKEQRGIGDYHLSVVEFDDQGWFADRRQMEALFELLDGLEGPTLIHVYAHGWKHNADSCDNNVVCFSRLLERTHLMGTVMGNVLSENESEEVKIRNVVGVYIGWRGLPFESVLNNLSFWSRKDTAARVGRGGVFELLTRLKDYRDNRKQAEKIKVNKPERFGTQLIITGHSFGGLVIYSALSHALMERAAKTITKADGDGVQYRVAESFGDFVMLVNPAFEGSMYEPLFNIATNRCYEESQKPVMMIVTSDADEATKTAFPVGRILGSLFQHKKSPDQKASMHNAIGHNARYRTHRLISVGVKKEEKTEGEKEQEKIERECGCEHIKPTSVGDAFTMLSPLFSTYLNHVMGQAAVFNKQRYGEEVMLVPTALDSALSPRYTGHYPYLVVSTDVGVIEDHNAIYNKPFMDFTMAFITQHVTDDPVPWTPKSDKAIACFSPDNTKRSLPLIKSKLIPNKRSCQLANGKSCTDP